MTAGNNSGDKPTARAIENSSASSTGRSNSTLMANATTTSTSMTWVSR